MISMKIAFSCIFVSDDSTYSTDLSESFTEIGWKIGTGKSILESILINHLDLPFDPTFPPIPSPLTPQPNNNSARTKYLKLAWIDTNIKFPV